MDFSIYFCNDGILRVKLSTDSPAIPMTFIQKNSSLNDFKFWVKWWNNYVFFEEGLTVAKFLLCLEPWAEFWSDMINIDILAYIDEVKKPILINEQHDSIDWIEISYCHELTPNVNHGEMDLDDLENWFNSPKNTNLTGKWNFSSYYKTSGFKLNLEEHYAIDFIPLYKLANVPLVLNDKQFIYIHDNYMDKIIGKNKFLKPNAFGVCKKNNIKFLTGEKYHTVKNVIGGFFLHFDYSPKSRDQTIEIIQESLASITEHSNRNNLTKNKENIVSETNNSENNLSDNILTFKSKNTNTPISSINNDISENLSSPQDSNDSSNVVSINSVKNNQTQHDDKVKINIHSNALTSILNTFDNHENYWSNVLELAKNDNSVILKIGNINPQKSLENRLLGYIIHDTDVDAIPKPSEPKFI